MARTGSETEQGPGRFLISSAAALAVTFGASTVAAAEDASDLPSTWHVHDGQGATLGPQHKGIGFFPTILGISTADYLLDPARCPNATDKAFLPSADSSEGPYLRAGQCRTSSAVIQLRTVPVGTSGPEGWSWLTSGAEPGWVT
jgi:hypothetical protein